MERGRIFEKNIPNNSGMMYLLFNGKRRNLKILNKIF